VTPHASFLALDVVPQQAYAIQRDFARDPVSWAAHTYLSLEKMSL
jgi:hypothetical protein